MTPNRRSILALGAALPLLGAAPGPAPVDAAVAWRRLFAGADGGTFAWWYQGTMFAHVDALREFPVVGLHAIMICRTDGGKDGAGVDFRTIGYFSDLDSDRPTDTWDNAFTGRREAIPPFYAEWPGRYALALRAGEAVLTLASQATRTNRVILTAAEQEGRMTISQVEGTLQGFPRLDGTLPPLADPAVTERQTRLQILDTPRGPRGFFSHVYDALPPWMGFGERLGSGLSKGVMRKARADEIVNPVGWAYLRDRVPAAFRGDRLVLA